ncbi:MAG: hypothetical protein GC204_10990 [Chloroflexi bacterium]|nr:hypothetical protein [Chloroflexota bacterium]
MDDEIRDLRDFLAHMGIDAEVRVDVVSNGPLIVITTEQFQQRRDWIERWFTLVRESSGYCYFHTRKRGTGDTN